MNSQLTLALAKSHHQDLLRNATNERRAAQVPASPSYFSRLAARLGSIAAGRRPSPTSNPVPDLAAQL
jgi:hypothetical protein